MKQRIKIILFLSLLAFSFVQLSCTGAYNALVNLQRLKFKLGTIDNFLLAGVNIKSVRSLNDFNVIDAAKLVSAFSRNDMPASFTLNVLVKNPNDGTGGTKQTSAVLKSLAWRLFLDNKETINGNIPNTIEIPGVGQSTTIPIVMSLDLVKFFKEQGYESIVNLALALGGVSGSSARVTLKATPTVDTFLGPITYPGEISIIDREFRGQ
jgi:hypothetical protein